MKLAILTTIALLSSSVSFAQRPSNSESTHTFWVQPKGTQNATWYTADMHCHGLGCQTSETSKSLLQWMKTTGTNISSALIWGGAIGAQWPKFLGQWDDPVSEPNHILHWDVEISGLPGSWHGHMIMLNIGQQNAVQGGVPGWPGQGSLLSNYDWAQDGSPGEQGGGGGIVGYAHCQRWIAGSFHVGWLGGIPPRELPFDVTSEKVDFMITEDISDPDYYWLWYRMLDAGFHIAPAAGSDYPCLSTELGSNHTVFSLPAETPLTFDRYIAAVRNGATVIRTNASSPAYLDFRVNDQPLGAEIDLPSGPTQVSVEIDAQASEPNTLLELVVNGTVVRSIPVDGDIQVYQTTVDLGRSSWLAARLVHIGEGPAQIRAHSAATFVRLGGCPIRLDPVAALYWVSYLNGYYEGAVLAGPVDPNFAQDVLNAQNVWMNIAMEGMHSCP